MKWIFLKDDGTRWVGRYLDGLRVYDRPATEADLDRLYDGMDGLHMERRDDPSARAWDDHVAAGGD